MVYRVVYKASVEKDLKKIDKTEAKKILSRIEGDLAKDPDKGSALSGTFQGLYRYRIGDYRVIYTKTVDGILVLRIGHEPAAARPPVHFLPHKSLPYVSVAPGRFSDTLLTFLDWLAQTHPPSIRIATGMHRGGPFVTIAPAGWGDAAPTPHRKKKIDSFARRFRMCGLVLHAKKEGFRLTLAEGPDAADVSAPVDLH